MASEPVDVSELLARCQFPDPGTVVTCGVSGGADSAALLVLARRAGLTVTAVHVDHGLRDGSSNEAAFVDALAQKTGAGFRSETVVIEPGADLEQRARIGRHRVLGPNAMLGHTADDQAETLLINLLRGAGLYGLGAMRPNQQHPILALRRWETHQLCVQENISPFKDPSNENPRFVRNRIRHEALPLLADISGRDLVPLLTRTADVVRSTAEDIDELAAGVDPTDSRALAALPPTVAIAALRGWLRDDLGHPPSAADLARVLAVVEHKAIACEVSGGRRVARTNGMLRIEPSR